MVSLVSPGVSLSRSIWLSLFASVNKYYRRISSNANSFREKQLHTDGRKWLYRRLIVTRVFHYNYVMFRYNYSCTRFLISIPSLPARKRERESWSSFKWKKKREITVYIYIYIYIFSKHVLKLSAEIMTRMMTNSFYFPRGAGRVSERGGETGGRRAGIDGIWNFQRARPVKSK